MARERYAPVSVSTRMTAPVYEGSRGAPESARAPSVGSLAMQRTVVFIALVGFALAAAAAAEEPEVYPAKGQTVEQQERDQFECHEWATKDTGVDPVALAEGQPGGATPSSNEGGAARGAGIGAMRGAAEGNAAAGAARGVGIGRMISVLRAKRQLREQQAKAAQRATVHNELDKYDRAYAACLIGRGYSVK